MKLERVVSIDVVIIMKDRIPLYSEALGGRDWCGNIVENFNQPINLMFGTYFTIIQGTAVEAIAKL